jgi:hypothetical protein
MSKNLQMHIHIYVNIRICLCIHIYVYACICTLYIIYVYTYVYIYFKIYKYTYIYIYAYKNIYICIYIYIFTYTYIYVRVYIHVYTYLNKHVVSNIIHVSSNSIISAPILISIRTWYSIDGSFREFLQIAHVSAQISHDHIVTAFHFLISNRGAEDVDTLESSFPPPSSIATTSTSFASDMILYFLNDFRSLVLLRWKLKTKRNYLQKVDCRSCDFSFISLFFRPPIVDLSNPGCPAPEYDR